LVQELSSSSVVLGFSTCEGPEQLYTFHTGGGEDVDEDNQDIAIAGEKNRGIGGKSEEK
jgi:hypothetical protein